MVGISSCGVEPAAIIRVSYNLKLSAIIGNWDTIAFPWYGFSQNSL
jgi:hypothetical protein